MNSFPLYSLVIQCTTRKQAGRAYDLTRNLVYLHECDLTNARLWLDGTYFVVVVGLPPEGQLRQKLEAVVDSVGATRGQIPPALLLYLNATRPIRLRGRSFVEDSYDPPFQEES